MGLCSWFFKTVQALLPSAAALWQQLTHPVTPCACLLWFGCLPAFLTDTQASLMLKVLLLYRPAYQTH